MYSSIVSGGRICELCLYTSYDVTMRLRRSGGNALEQSVVYYPFIFDLFRIDASSEENGA